MPLRRRGFVVLIVKCYNKAESDIIQQKQAEKSFVVLKSNTKEK